jgi:hypothetical protein
MDLLKNLFEKDDDMEYMDMLKVEKAKERKSSQPPAKPYGPWSGVGAYAPTDYTLAELKNKTDEAREKVKANKDDKELKKNLDDLLEEQNKRAGNLSTETADAAALARYNRSKGLPADTAKPAWTPEEETLESNAAFSKEEEPLPLGAMRRPPQPHPAHTDPAELEHSITATGISSLQSDPFIEQGKENIPDASIFRQFIHVGAELAFDYAKDLTGFGSTIDIGLDATKRLFGIELSSLVDLAIENVQNNSRNSIGSLRASKPNRIKLQIKNADMGEHAVINNAVLYPLLMVSFKFYLINIESTVNPPMGFDFVFKQGLEYLLKNYVKLTDDKIKYFMWCWSAYPKLLSDAYIRNRDSINGVTREEREAIIKFHTNAMEEYDRIFYPQKYIQDVKRYEHGGTALNQMLINLANPVFLYEIAKIFGAVDEFISNSVNNQGLLMGLMGILYSRAVKDGTNMGDALLSNARIDGIVFYNRQTNAPKLNDFEINLIKNAKEEIEEHLINGKSYIVFRGTALNKKDVMKNILNIAGSSEMFTNEAFNSRIVKAMEIIEKREKEGIPIEILGYSLGGIYAMYMASIYPEIPVKVYNPVIASNEDSKYFMDGLANQNPNLIINTVEGDPVSINAKLYKDKFNIKERKKSRFFDSHSLENYIF